MWRETDPALEASALEMYPGYEIGREKMTKESCVELVTTQTTEARYKEGIYLFRD